MSYTVLDMRQVQYSWVSVLISIDIVGIEILGMGVVCLCGYLCWQRRKGPSATAPDTLSLTPTPSP